ncbi:uncharacterized protein BJ212DRAFT_1482850 [Suillus subaureus]|uniref:DUF6532 domain-containing protein n=1 Tax=Suillus subaureus TaxID=48587 RepID=A0A9P7E723_9AGAM|nr:uncharacterized protein BJ212DRAFT_1482850 [Suillus subaureus]KAG1812775.1 hypothetical protein BJ212DRAFT_1482850 [Suillus subaureus]
MPPRAVASPKKKRSKRKASDASKASLLKKPHAANPIEIPSMPLVSLGLTKVDAADAAPRHSGHPNAGTGGRNAQLEKIGVVLEAKSWNQKPKGTTSLGMVNPMNPQAPEPHRKGQKNRQKVLPPPYSPDPLDFSASPQVPYFLLQQNGRRFGFVASTTTRVVPPGTEPNPQVLNNPYLEQHNQNTFTDHSCSSQPQTTATLSDYNIDPALHKEGDIARQGLHARLVGSDLEDSDSSGSSTDTDIDKDNDKEGKDKGKGEDKDKDKDKGDKGDKGENNESQFGWGEAHQRQKGHPGFSAEGLPTQARVAHPLTPDFEFQYSCNEDEDSARMHLNNSNQPLGTLPGVQQEQSDPQTNTSKAEDVLKHHHKKNGQPHLPNPEMLQLLNQVAESVDQVQHQSKSKKPKGSDGLRPDQLAWYGPHWKSFLEEAKGECHRQHALENPFPPLVKEMPGTISEVLLSVLVTWDKNSRQFEAGIWPEQQYNMMRLLYDDLSTWQSDLKKTAINIVPLSYLLLPPPSVPPQQHATWVENAAKNLLQGGLYLQFGIDKNGQTRNLANPALHNASIACFLHRTLPDCMEAARSFSHTIANIMLSLSCHSGDFHCVFDGLEKNGNGKHYPNFSSKKYLPIYQKMLDIIKNTLKDKYHGPRLSAQLQEWAEAGWAENLKLDGGTMEARHDHLQVILD